MITNVSSIKRELTLRTYEILKSEGCENIDICRIEAETGCTSAVIYEHFENLEHLLCFASIGLLDGYVQDFMDIIKEDTGKNVLDMDLRLWESFAYYAFKNVQSCELLFWGPYKKQLGTMISEHYRMFRGDTEDIDGLSADVLFSSDLRERAYILFRNAAAAGCLLVEDIDMLSDMASCLFRGTLLEYKDCYRLPGRAEEGVEHFMKMLRDIISRYRLA